MGLLKKQPGKIILQSLFFVLWMFCGVLGILFAAGRSDLFYYTRFFVALGAYLLLLLGTLGLAAMTHTASHQAVSPKRWVNSSLLYLGFPLLLGVSATYWIRRHIQLHHASPNVVGVDEDIEQRPVLTLVLEQFESSRGALRLWYQCSRYLLPVLLLGNGPSMQLTSIWHVLHGLFSRRASDYLLDSLMLVSHYALWLGLLSFWEGLWGALLLHVIWSAGVGYLLYCTFVPAHLPKEALFISPGAPGDFVRRQTATTLNFSVGPFYSFLIGGLEYQIEHHLFPGVPHTNLAKISPYVEAFCRENGYEHRTMPYREALWNATASFFTRKPIRPLTGPQGD